MAEKAARNRGACIDPRWTALTFAEVSARWLAANPAKRPSALARDETIVRVHLLPVLALRPLGSVTQPDVQALVNAWTAAPRTVRRQYGVLRAVFGYAFNADWLVRSRAATSTCPRSSRSSGASPTRPSWRRSPTPSTGTAR